MLKLKKKKDNKEKKEKTPKPAGFMQMVLAGLLVFLLGGGLVIGYFHLVGIPGVSNAEQKKEEEKDKGPTGTLDLGTILVNLADPGGTRYLKVAVVLEYPKNEKLTRELEEKEYEITDLIITTLRSKNVDQIQPLEKVDALKKEMVTAVNKRLTSGKITHLFFTEYIIQ